MRVSCIDDIIYNTPNVLKRKSTKKEIASDTGTNEWIVYGQRSQPTETLNCIFEHTQQTMIIPPKEQGNYNVGIFESSFSKCFPFTLLKNPKLAFSNSNIWMSVFRVLCLDLLERYASSRKPGCDFGHIHRNFMIGLVMRGSNRW